MEFATGFGGLLPSTFEQVGVEEDGLNLPDAFPSDANITFLSETFAGRFGLLQHPGEGGGIEVPLVEGEPALGDDAGDDARLVVQDPMVQTPPLLRSAIR